MKYTFNERVWVFQPEYGWSVPLGSRTKGEPIDVDLVLKPFRFYRHGTPWSPGSKKWVTLFDDKCPCGQPKLTEWPIEKVVPASIGLRDEESNKFKDLVLEMVGFITLWEALDDEQMFKTAAAKAMEMNRKKAQLQKIRS